MGERTLSQQIDDVLEVAGRPLSVGDIRRRLAGYVEAGEISSRLSKMKGQGRVFCVQMPSQAITGPRIIKGWISERNRDVMEYIPSIVKRSEKNEITSGEVASTDETASRAA